ncbi:MAG: AbrB/MazE/SpoVT family DNA-binding domain-containing protein [Nitrososphaerales archaeon]
MSGRAIVGKRFSIVVPKSVRKRLNIREGQHVIVKVEEGKLVIELLPSEPLKVLERVIGEPYNEHGDERRAEKWLVKHARS